MCEALPCREQEGLPVDRSQTHDRLAHELMREAGLRNGLRARRRLDGHRRHFAGQMSSPTGAAPLVADDPSARPVQPPQLAVVRREVVAAPPRDSEDLCGGVGTADRSDASGAVGSDVGVVALVEALEPGVVALYRFPSPLSMCPRSPPPGQPEFGFRRMNGPRGLARWPRCCWDPP